MPASPTKTKPAKRSADSPTPVLKLTAEDIKAMKDAQKETGISSRAEVLRQALRIGLPIFVQTWRELQAKARNTPPPAAA